jgi:hypothetical protein
VERVKAQMLTEPLRRSAHLPPVSEDDLIRAKVRLGFGLPPLLRELYLRVGNGGFGPGYSFYPLDNGADPKALQSDSLLTTYLALRSMTPQKFDR